MNSLILLIEKTINKNIISESLEYHIVNDLGVDRNIYRPGSKEFFNLFKEVRDLNKKGLYKLNTDEKFYVLNTDIGNFGLYEGENVPLDFPMFEGQEELQSINEKAKRKRKRKTTRKKSKTTTPSSRLYKGRKVDLNKPRRGGKKKFYVYVRNPKTGKIIKVEWGARGMSVGISDPARRKSFAARHRCATHANDKTKPRYWACRTGRYPHLTGSKKKYTWW
jgi:hypothetical protein